MLTPTNIRTLATTVVVVLAASCGDSSAVAQQPPSSRALNLQFPDENIGPGVPRGSVNPQSNAIPQGNLVPQGNTGRPAGPAFNDPRTNGGFNPPGLNGAGLGNPQLGGLGGAFGDQGLGPNDPTQPSTDMRRILQGQQEQTRRDPPPAIQVAGKVIGANGKAKALLRINQRYYMIYEGASFSVPTGPAPTVFTVTGIDAEGVTLQGEDKQSQRLQ